MQEKSNSAKDFLTYPAAALFFALIFLLQYQFRSFDDNRLTSWESAFRFADFRRTLIIVTSATLFAIPLCRFLFSRQYRSLILFLVSFAAATPFWNMPEAMLDASRYFTQAKHLELYGVMYFLREWGGSIFAWTDLPVVPFIYGMLFRVFGEHRLLVQIVTAVFFSMTAVLTYFLGSKVKDEETGYAAGLLLCGIPYIFPQTALMMVDVALMFFCLLAVYMSLFAVRRGGAWIPLAALAVWIAFFCKYSAWIVLSAIPLLWMALISDNKTLLRGADGHQNRSKMLVNAWITALLSCLLVTVLFVAREDVFVRQFSLLREYQAPGLRRWGESFLSTFFFQVHPVITLAALVSLWYTAKNRDLRQLSLAGPLILLIALQVRRSRYIIMAFPMLTLMASYGLTFLIRPRLRQFIVASVIVSSIVTACFVYRPLLARNSFANLSAAAELLNNSDAEAVEVVTVYSNDAPADPAVTLPILDLFLKKPILYKRTASNPETREQMTSALRFTWKFPNPAYYEKSVAAGKKTAFVILSGTPGPELPPELREKLGSYSNIRSFLADDNEYEFRTFVTVGY